MELKHAFNQTHNGWFGFSATGLFKATAQSIKIDNIELNETEIKQKLVIAEQDIQYNRIHTAEEVRQNLIG